MAWRQPGDKPLSEPMMVNLLTHICVTRPQWVNQIPTFSFVGRSCKYCLLKDGHFVQLQWVNSLRLSDSYMHQWTRPSLVQIMACRLFGTKPLSEPMLTKLSFGHLRNKIQWNFITIKTYLFMHYSDVIMDTMESQITSLTIVYSAADQRKYQSSASLAFVRGIHRWRGIPRTNGQ